MPTKLWTNEPPTVCERLNGEHASLVTSLSNYFGKPVILHNRSGRFAPFVNDDSSIHIFIDSAPVTKQKHASGVMSARIRSRTNAFGEPRLKRNTVCKSSDLTTIYAYSSDDVICQFRDNCVWILVQPHLADDAVFQETSLSDILIHIALRMRITHASVARPLPSEMSHETFEWVISEWPETSALLQPLIEARLEKALNHTVRSFCGVRRRGLEKRLEESRSRKAQLSRYAEELTRNLRFMREKALSLINLDHQTKVIERAKHEILSILDMPQVEKVSVETLSTPRLVVDLRPMALGIDKNLAGNDIKVLQPLTISLTLDCHGRPLVIKSASQDRNLIPHQRTHICLGNIDSILCTLLQKGELHAAMQIVIGFLQTYNEQDSWGVSGTYWPAFDAVEIEEGNCVRLKEPAPHQTTTVTIETKANAASEACLVSADQETHLEVRL